MEYGSLLYQIRLAASFSCLWMPKLDCPNQLLGYIPLEMIALMRSQKWKQMMQPSPKPLTRISQVTLRVSFSFSGLFSVMFSVKRRKTHQHTTSKEPFIFVHTFTSLHTSLLLVHLSCVVSTVRFCLLLEIAQQFKANRKPSVVENVKNSMSKEGARHSVGTRVH